MKNIRVTMSDATYDRLMQRAIREGYPDIEFLLHNLVGERPTVAHSIYLDLELVLAKRELKEFTVAQLIEKLDYDVCRSDTLKVGRMFASAVRNNPNSQYSYKDKTSSNHAIYMIKDLK